MEINAFNLANIYLFKGNNRNIKICSKVTIKRPEWHRSGVFIVIFEHITHLFLEFLLLQVNVICELRGCIMNNV